MVSWFHTEQCDLLVVSQLSMCGEGAEDEV